MFNNYFDAGGPGHAAPCAMLELPRTSTLSTEQEDQRQRPSTLLHSTRAQIKGSMVHIAGHHQHPTYSIHLRPQQSSDLKNSFGLGVCVPVLGALAYGTCIWKTLFAPAIQIEQYWQSWSCRCQFADSSKTTFRHKFLAWAHREAHLTKAATKIFDFSRFDSRRLAAIPMHIEKFTTLPEERVLNMTSNWGRSGADPTMPNPSALYTAHIDDEFT
ncbi:hypothetical protein F5882DRAFT_387714 [Hyaloscypha sp. PMI_1271]|nr:hypothetical protein F5882DRAFT_387714 [Hyaloscypha sp. PMI_1271]